MPQPTSAPVVKGGQFLTFRLMKEKYGIEILKVREIIGMIDITPVPQTPPFVKGVINLRGKIIPVVDLRIKFGMDSTEYSKETCMIIVDLKAKQVALIVDAVHDVVDLKSDNIDEASFGIQINTEFISGIGKLGSEVVILLQIDRILSSEEFVAVNTLGA